jgi:hypothetical protein
LPTVGGDDAPLQLFSKTKVKTEEVPSVAVHAAVATH